MIRYSTPARILGLAALAAFLGGCGGVDGVELNGKVFDALGINSSSAEEPKLVARSALIVPPNLERLPQPGAQPAAEAMEVASINDPDKKLEVNEEQLQKQQAEYCKIHYEQATQRGDNTADLAKGPLGPCRGSVMNITKMIVGGEEKN
jgi:hypothetical protein